MSQSKRAILLQAVFISVMAVIAGRLADRAFPEFRASGILGGVIGGVVSGLLAVWFERQSKSKSSPHDEKQDRA